MLLKKKVRLNLIELVFLGFISVKFSENARDLMRKFGVNRGSRLDGQERLEELRVQAGDI